MEPKAHVRRAGTFRPDFVAQIFDRDPRSLQVFECLSQHCHARQVKRHVTDRFRRWFSFEQSDRHVLVPNRDTILIFEFNGRAERTLEPCRAAFWTGNRQSEMADCPPRERNFHAAYVNYLNDDANPVDGRIYCEGGRMSAISSPNSRQGRKT